VFVRYNRPGKLSHRLAIRLWIKTGVSGCDAGRLWKHSAFPQSTEWKKGVDHFFRGPLDYRDWLRIVLSSSMTARTCGIPDSRHSLNGVFTMLYSLVSSGFFVLFWCLTLAAFMSRSRTARNVYLGFFFAALFAAGIGGQRFLIWPFHNWNLWPQILPREKEYIEVWLEDARGRQIIYDPRAVPPMSSTFLNMMNARRIWDRGERGEKSRVAEWLLERANAYAPRPSVLESLRLSPKDLTYYEGRGRYENADVSPVWPSDHDTFVALILKKKHVAFGPLPGTQARYTLMGVQRHP